MTVDQIIDAIWGLTWYEVFKIAIIDDFILLVKIWPVYFIIVGLFVYFLMKRI